eukprot:gene39382-53241_t
MKSQIGKDTVVLTAVGKFKHKVSSVLNGSSEYSGKNMFTEDLISCWNSDQGVPQFIFIEFSKMVRIDSFSVVFQGGFVGQQGVVEVGESISTMSTIAELEDFMDSNDEQEINLPDCPSNCKYMKITFNGSTDFF